MFNDELIGHQAWIRLRSKTANSILNLIIIAILCLVSPHTNCHDCRRYGLDTELSNTGLNNHFPLQEGDYAYQVLPIDTKSLQPKIDW